VGHLTSDADVGEDKLELAARRDHEAAWPARRAPRCAPADFMNAFIQEFSCTELANFWIGQDFAKFRGIFRWCP